MAISAVVDGKHIAVTFALSGVVLQQPPAFSVLRHKTVDNFAFFLRCHRRCATIAAAVTISAEITAPEQQIHLMATCRGMYTTIEHYACCCNRCGIGCQWNRIVPFCESRLHIPLVAAVSVEAA